MRIHHFTFIALMQTSGVFRHTTRTSRRQESGLFQWTNYDSTGGGVTSREKMQKFLEIHWAPAIILDSPQFRQNLMKFSAKIFDLVWGSAEFAKNQKKCPKSAKSFQINSNNAKIKKMRSEWCKSLEKGKLTGLTKQDKKRIFCISYSYLQSSVLFAPPGRHALHHRLYLLNQRSPYSRY